MSSVINKRENPTPLFSPLNKRGKNGKCAVGLEILKWGVLKNPPNPKTYGYFRNTQTQTYTDA